MLSEVPPGSHSASILVEGGDSRARVNGRTHVPTWAQMISTSDPVQSNLHPRFDERNHVFAKQSPLPGGTVRHRAASVKLQLRLLLGPRVWNRDH